ncbi:MAG: hypothetical protein KUA43_01520 [Hoeflea sp.]|uniref:baeRF11 domain-containing protein n=1 Tax=Hoeflea sp. TaxID=1940281 RepID=UPI001D306A77|nr:hypothetical protein [Hoeflea sp.]MBU4530513.1 hypothetical protein [Alphaproteobacteria bacterium]MBU4545300.1 hypothetical protein [Alphaproteobacteria bacterium]MBU4548949.1 hypothetical protein [Alphaproteobacteria bacterium]MBV1722104.1 hypothetical protein [Hoeflea sp.]MBV1761454.1 hypothetical protein [Hoeflea sp.]
MLYLDLPTPTEMKALSEARDRVSVSIYLVTTPESQNIGASVTRLGHMLKEAETQLADAGFDKRDIWPISEQVHDLMDDEEFWQRQAHALAIFVTPARLVTHRFAARITETVQVSDRFHINPLLRSLTVPQSGYVLALEENRVRLFDVTAGEHTAEIKVPHMPKDAHSAAGTSTVNSRSASGRVQGDEGQKLRLRQYARKVDAALRPYFSGRSEPLILAASEPLLSIFRSVNSYPHLIDAAIEASPAKMSEADIQDHAQPLIRALHEIRVSSALETLAARENEGRATTDIAQAARAATFGAIDTLLVDMDEDLAGTVDEVTGEVTFAKGESASSYGVIDEIAGRVLASGGTVLAVRKADLPENASLAAILRFAI